MRGADERYRKAVEVALCVRYGASSATVKVSDTGYMRADGWHSWATLKVRTSSIRIDCNEIQRTRREALRELALVAGLKDEDIKTTETP